jgi:hypothetical protein
MTGQVLQPVRWSRRRWTVTIVSLLLAQLALVSYFGERSHLLPRAVRSRTALHLAFDPLSTKQLADLATVDPALFALPSLNGFSANGWLRFHEPDYRPEKWTEAPIYLALDAAQLGRGIESDETNAAPWPVSATRMVPETVEPISLPPLPAPGGSTVQVEDALKTRKLLNFPSLPAWQNDDLLTNTVVQVLVDQAGNAISALLLKSSGLKAADDFGLQTAASARFEPIAPVFGSDPARTCVFGRLVFQWQTVAPSLTKSVSSSR